MKTTECRRIGIFYRCPNGHLAKSPPVKYISGSTRKPYEPCIDCLINKLKELGIPEYERIDDDSPSDNEP